MRLTGIIINRRCFASAVTHREDTCALQYDTGPTLNWQITSISGTGLALKFSSAEATTGLGTAV